MIAKNDLPTAPDRHLKRQNSLQQISVTYALTALFAETVTNRYASRRKRFNKRCAKRIATIAPPPTYRQGHWRK
jgi:hypothetical protein